MKNIHKKPPKIVSLLIAHSNCISAFVPRLSRKKYIQIIHKIIKRFKVDSILDEYDSISCNRAINLILNQLIDLKLSYENKIRLLEDIWTMIMSDFSYFKTASEISPPVLLIRMADALISQSRVFSVSSYLQNSKLSSTGIEPRSSIIFQEGSSDVLLYCHLGSVIPNADYMGDAWRHFLISSITKSSIIKKSSHIKTTDLPLGEGSMKVPLSSVIFYKDRVHPVSMIALASGVISDSSIIIDKNVADSLIKPSEFNNLPEMQSLIIILKSNLNFKLSLRFAVMEGSNQKILSLSESKAEYRKIVNKLVSVHGRWIKSRIHPWSHNDEIEIKALVARVSRIRDKIIQKIRNSIGNDHLNSNLEHILSGLINIEKELIKEESPDLTLEIKLLIGIAKLGLSYDFELNSKKKSILDLFKLKDKTDGYNSTMDFLFILAGLTRLFKYPAESMILTRDDALTKILLHTDLKFESITPTTGEAQLTFKLPSRFIPNLRN